MKQIVKGFRGYRRLEGGRVSKKEEGPRIVYWCRMCGTRNCVLLPEDSSADVVRATLCATLISFSAAKECCADPGVTGFYAGVEGGIP